MAKFTIEEIQKLVNGKYDVIKYDGSKKPIILNCPKHGNFEIRIDHLREKINGEVCPKCEKEKNRIKCFEDFKEKADEIHGQKYIYHKDKFIKMSAKTTITCPIHGDFEQLPINHIHSKQGCPKCADERKKGRYKYSKEEIVEICKKTHGDKYIYDDIVFQGIRNKILNIKCRKHGYFDQVAYDHIKGFGCEKCKFEKQLLSKEEFIEKAIKIHNGKYTYDKDKIVYVNNNVKIPIICPIHGEFWQRPANHLLGIGCPYCQTSKLENEIIELLTSNGIYFIQKYHTDWLGRLELDFYLPKYNTAIECQGKQHFEQVKHFGEMDAFETRLERDKRKAKLCNENGVKLLYYSNLGIEYPYKVFEDKEQLLNEIRGTNH